MKHLIALLIFSFIVTACQQVEKDVLETSVKILEDAEEDIVEEIVKETSSVEEKPNVPASAPQS